jgi:formate dehydrogenase major subunit
MYILGENPAMSDPDVEHAREALAKLDHLVVQDIFLTETANYADVILPASAFAREDRHRDQHQPAGADGPPRRRRRRARRARTGGSSSRAGQPLRAGLDYDAPRGLRRDEASMRSLRQHHLGAAGGENAVTYPSLSPDDPGQAIVFGDGFPRRAGAPRFTPASVIAAR